MLRRLFGRGPKPTRVERLTSHDPFLPGDLLSVVMEEGFAVVKVLATDSEGVHARLYVQRFAQRPARDDLGELTTAPFGAGHDNPFSIGHVPLSHQSFAGWQPELLARGELVAEEELEGYLMWQDAEGGYF